MREKQPRKWRRLFAILATFGLVSLIFASVEAAPAVAGGADTTTVHVKQSSLSDHYGDCSATGNASGQLNVTDPTNVNQDSVVVTTNKATYTAADVTFKMVGNVLQIQVPLGADEFITDATIQANSAWSGQFVLSHYDCLPPPPPTPVPGTATAKCGACSNPYEANGTAIVEVTNTADDTHAEVTYDVTLNGVTQQLTLADGATGSVTFDNLAPGDYDWSVTGPDGTDVSGTVKVKQCETPPPTPTPGTATASPTACSTVGQTTGTVEVDVTNTADATQEDETYTVSVEGAADQQVTIADGATQTVTFTGLAVGDHAWSVTGSDGTDVSGTVTVEQCEVPPVLHPKASASADCTGAVTFHLNNKGSNVEVTFTLEVGNKLKEVPVAGGASKTVIMHGRNGARFAVWVTPDIIMDHGTIPRACAVRHPAGHINCRCSGTVVFHLNNTNSNRAVTYHETIGGRSWNVRVGAGQKLVNERHGAAHARVRLAALGKTLDKARIPAKCAPPNQPPPTGEKHATGGKVVSGKA